MRGYLKISSSQLTGLLWIYKGISNRVIVTPKKYFVTDSLRLRDPRDKDIIRILGALNSNNPKSKPARYRMSPHRPSKGSDIIELDDDETEETEKREWSANYKFVDRVILEVKGGKGGNGCIAHEMPNPAKKIATGGSGGKGGNVYLVVDKSMVSLNFQHFHFNASDGNHGKGDGMTGRNGDDVFIPVPLGTLVSENFPDYLRENDNIEEDDVDELERSEGILSEKDAWAALSARPEKEYLDDENGEFVEEPKSIKTKLGQQKKAFIKNQKEKKDSIGGVYEMNKLDDILLVASGGKAGIGNKAMKGTLTNRKRSTPRTKIPGEAGESRSITLELKLIADVGLVGYPNAGKSSLLRVMSNARPKVAAYAFTTLNPSVGIVEYSDLERITVADIPGIIEGAHLGRGLGHDFLRHIERTKVLLFVIDAAGTEGRAPDKDLRNLIEEIRRYNPHLLSRPCLVFGNKTDLEVNSSQLRMLRYCAKRFGMKVITGSTSDMTSIPDLAKELRLLKEQYKEDRQLVRNISQSKSSKPILTRPIKKNVIVKKPSRKISINRLLNEI